MVVTSRWKGKGRETVLETRDEGPGGAEGVVLSLDQVGSGVYDVAYTLPVRFGRDNTQQFSLQIDTGSSDLWVASTSCSTSTCKQASGRLYNPSRSTSTGFDFTIHYINGLASGPIVWDSVTVGGYSIENQALAAADDVSDEPLSPNFSGILGLALPLNSVIATTIPPVVNNNPDGAAWASNLFSITPVDQAPASRFISLALARPGSDRIPSVLGIGRHPEGVVSDPSQIRYSTLVGERTGTLFWKVSIRAINVYVNGEQRPVTLGRSNTGAVFPSAVIDSGIPLILTTTPIANAIYGAIGISPASDGMYYVPCDTPLNMTITVDNRPEIPLHPLDLTTEPPEDNRAQFCVGLIQTADAALTNPSSAIGDMILGVPFLRNVYTVMAYVAPEADGSFPPVDSSNATNLITPRIGFLPLTSPTVALEEFKTVRVLNQPISSSTPTPAPHSNDNTDNGPKKLSVGIIVLISLLGFFAMCCVIFAIRWFVLRRRFKKAQEADYGLDEKTAYVLARSRGTSGLDFAPSEDELRRQRYEAYVKRDSQPSVSDGDRTHVGVEPGDAGEFGLKKHYSGGVDDGEPWDATIGLAWGDPHQAPFPTHQRNSTSPGQDVPLISDQDRNTPPSSPPFPRPQNADLDPLSVHRHMDSIEVPLLDSSPPTNPVDHRHNLSTSPGLISLTLDSDSTLFPSLSQTQHVVADNSNPELGLVDGDATMAGIGTASRRSKASADAMLRDSQGTILEPFIPPSLTNPQPPHLHLHGES